MCNDARVAMAGVRKEGKWSTWRWLQKCLLYRIRTSHFVIFLFLHSLLIFPLTSHAQSYPSFRNSESDSTYAFQNVIIDERTEEIFIGGVNSLYRLTSDLDLQTRTVTGPKDDSVECRPSPFNCDDEDTKVPTNNVNKILLLYNDQLIHCGSVYQGICEFRDKESLNVTFAGVRYEVAANNAYGSSVAFVGDGPYDNPLMYVGTSNADWFRSSIVPTISSRILFSSSEDELFEVAKNFNTMKKSQIIIPSNTLSTSPLDQPFNISYITAFSSGKFSYFVAMQPSDHTQLSAYRTKIVRLCQKDASYDSYIELPLSCTKENIHYNLAQAAFLANISLSIDSDNLEEVLVVAFATSESETTLEPTMDFAVCLYPVSDINRQMWNRRLGCAKQDTDNTEIEWLGNTPCAASDLLIKRIESFQPEDYCHTISSLHPLGGADPIEASSVYTGTDEVTAVAATQHFNSTIIFLGNKEGQLQKLHLFDGSEATMYETLSLHQTPIIKNGFLFTPDDNSIFVTSQDQISKVPVEECELYSSCDACRAAADPYCGWCTLLARCTRRTEAECPDSKDGRSIHWLAQDEECIDITSTDPPFAPANSQTNITLNVKNLPNTSLYKCMFGLFGSLNATIERVIGQMSVVGCQTPESGVTLPAEGQTTVTLSLLYDNTNGGAAVSVATTNFDFYNCDSFATCSLCAGNKYGCHWCPMDNRCRDGAAICGGGSSIRNDMQCPKVTSSEEILIPAGNTQRLILNAENLPSTGDYRCHISFPTKKQNLTASFVNSTTIICHSMTYTYDAMAVKQSGTLTIYWKNFAIETNSALEVTVYKCDLLASTIIEGIKPKPTCGKCLSTDAKYNCGWCMSSDNCVSPNSQPLCEVNVLREGDGCPNPNIVGFEPMSGHIAGGTEISITGYNLGLTIDDIAQIKVAGQECDSIDFMSAQKINCTTSEVQQPRAGNISITFTNPTNMPAVSSTYFFYVKPTIDSIFPSQGPIAGGTLISIRGKHLYSGSDISARIVQSPCNDANNMSCTIVSIEENEVQCTTSASSDITSNYIQMRFDNGCETNLVMPFEYKANPTIERLEMSRSVIAGGIKLPIMGTNFDVVYSGEIEFRIEDQTFTGNCENTSSDGLVCFSPAINISGLPLPYTLTGAITINLDGYSVELSEMFVFYPNPTYYRFVDVNNTQNPEKNTLVREYRDKSYIDIKGVNLTLGASVDDISVHLDERECVVISITSTLLRCDPTSMSIDAGKYKVEVMHGSILKFQVGYVRYLPEEFQLVLVLGPVAAGLLVILIITVVIVFILSCRNKFDNKKLLIYMEEQRDAMEMTVAQECKDAFAELQTGVLSITHDVEGTGIPMWDYRSYALRALFPSNLNHPVLRELPLPSGQKEAVKKGLTRFGTLLSNKTFLLNFVDVLEKQNTMGPEDLSNVASLLMVVLQTKMDYTTDIIKTLLSRAIKDHVREGVQSVLMRRGVFIVEKMVSHWLALLLYPFLEETAGEPLFNLFYAIKRQISQGPVDEVTGEARYGLNEASLIRQQVDHKYMVIFVKGIENNLDEVKVTVLNCDTISQVKEKVLEEIYKTSPFSQRPHKEELDLEWSDSPTGRLILLDYEGGRSSVDGWKQLNTLTSYGVIDGAKFSILPAQNGNTSLSSSSSSPSRSYVNVHAYLSPSSSLSPIITHEKEQVTKLMHLVKLESKSPRKGERDNKMMAEIYLTRLLTTKGILQQFVDDLLSAIWTVDEEGYAVPLAIKYLFDFLDEQAKENNITDSQIIHQWKSNCLQLRFWVNLIKNPDFVFDVHKSTPVNNCLSVIGQCLMDSCSTSQQTLTKDSPSSRLLYAKDIPQYKQNVVQYYRDISRMPMVSDQDMNTMLADHSNLHRNVFHPLSALNELYFCYVGKCNTELMHSLKHDESAVKHNLADKMLEVDELLSS